jgi:hypothetical protein
MELHVAAALGWREAPAVLHLPERPARVLGHAGGVHLERRGVEHYAAREALAECVIADRHLRNQRLRLTRALALLDEERLAQGKELGVLLHVGNEIEHLSRGEGHVAGGAERGHDGVGTLGSCARLRDQRWALSRAALSRAKSSPA